MPFVTHTRDVLALPSWRRLKQERQSSTAQETYSVRDGERTSAILHGKRSSPGLAVKESTSNHTGDPRTSRAATTARQRDAKSHPVKAVKPPQPASDPSRRHRAHSSVKPAPPRSSGKRRADSSISQRPARRRRGDQDAMHLELKDEAYIRKNMRIPVPDDYPALPANRFKQIKGSINDASQGIAEIELDIKMLTNQVFQTTLRYKSAIHNEVVIGEGRTKVAATNAAYLHLAAKLHEQGTLADILDKDSAVKKSLKKSTREELKSVWLDIYNYAARFDLIPTVKRATINRKERQRTRKYIQVTVELAEQNIKVAATGIAAKEAEARVGQLFKKEAEKYHAERGGGAIIIKDSGALTTDNAHMYFHFYRMTRPGSDRAQDIWEERKKAPPRVTIHMSGEPLGEPIEVVGTLEKKMAQRIAWLTAAIVMKRREPHLYPRYLQALKNGNGQILDTIPPVDMPVDEDCSLIMRETMLAARRAGLPDKVDELAPDIGGSETRTGGNPTPIFPSEPHMYSSASFTKSLY